MLSDYLVINFDKELLHRILISKVVIPSRQKKLIQEKGLYLKLYHVVYKKTLHGDIEYRYYGKYWYKVTYHKNKRKLIYMGHFIPEDLGIQLVVPIEGFSFVAYRFKKTPIFIKRNVYLSFSELLESLGIIPKKT